MWDSAPRASCKYRLIAASKVLISVLYLRIRTISITMISCVKNGMILQIKDSLLAGANRPANRAVPLTEGARSALAISPHRANKSWSPIHRRTVPVLYRCGYFVPFWAISAFIESVSYTLHIPHSLCESWFESMPESHTFIFSYLQIFQALPVPMLYESLYWVEFFRRA